MKKIILISMALLFVLSCTSINDVQVGMLLGEVSQVSSLQKVYQAPNYALYQSNFGSTPYLLKFDKDSTLIEIMQDYRKTAEINNVQIGMPLGEVKQVVMMQTLHQSTEYMLYRGNFVNGPYLLKFENKRLVEMEFDFNEQQRRIQLAERNREEYRKIKALKLKQQSLSEQRRVIQNAQPMYVIPRTNVKIIE